MGCHYIYNSHHSVLVDNSHLGFDTVELSFLDCDVIVRAGDAVVYHMRYNKAVRVQNLCDGH